MVWDLAWAGLALQAPKNDAPDVGESTHAELLDYELTGWNILTKKINVKIARIGRIRNNSDSIIPH